MSVTSRIELGILVVSGLLLGILTSAFLLVRIGSWPFPITAVIAGIVNIVIWKIAALYTRSAWQFAPLIAWLVVTVMAMLPIFGNGSLLTDWRLFLLLGLGLAAPAFYISNSRMRDLTKL